MVGEVFGTAFMIPAAQCEFDMDSSEKGLLNAIGYIGEAELGNGDEQVVTNTLLCVCVTVS
jgi:hypothetical protein